MPELHISRQHTTSFGIHSIDILAPIHLWNDFERTVRTQTDVIQLKRTHLANIPQDTATRANHIANEQLLCGDEASVQARFNQNVCHPISSIYALQEIQCRFGDAHTTNVGQNLGGIPDIICVTDNGGVRLVGEVKTPWIHKFKKVMRDPTLQRRWFGQIASYMRSSGCKYGFMTTYKETIFFKEDIDIANPNGYAFYFSPIIQHHTKSEKTPLNDAALRDKVSVRECSLYLGWEIKNNGWQSTNDVPKAHWIQSD